MSYELKRIIKHMTYTNQNNTVDRHDISFINKPIVLSDEDFEKLQNLNSEYQYVEYDNIIHIDRHPSKIKEIINNKDFVKDYQDNIGSGRFVVSYIYKRR